MGLQLLLSCSHDLAIRNPPSGSCCFNLLDDFLGVVRPKELRGYLSVRNGFYPLERRRDYRHRRNGVIVFVLGHECIRGRLRIHYQIAALQKIQYLRLVRVWVCGLNVLISHYLNRISDLIVVAVVVKQRGLPRLPVVCAIRTRYLRRGRIETERKKSDGKDCRKNYEPHWNCSAHHRIEIVACADASRGMRVFTNPICCPGGKKKRPSVLRPTGEKSEKNSKGKRRETISPGRGRLPRLLVRATRGRSGWSPTRRASLVLRGR